MNHYVDIAIRPDPEFVTSTLMNTLYQRLHRALAEARATDIGVSFPRATVKPRATGNLLRLHGEQGVLERLMSLRWWGGLGDHVEIRGPLAVPATAISYAVRRVQAQSSPERLRRRLAKRHGLSQDEARKRIPDSVAEKLEYPFVQLRSASTGREFKLFIRQEPVAQAHPGTFNCYGLSHEAAVPWF